MFWKAIFFVCSCLTASYSAAATSLHFRFNEDLDAKRYQKIVAPVVSASRFTFLSSPKPTNLAGFDAGIAIQYSGIPDDAKTEAARSVREGANFPGSLVFPRLTFQKGGISNFDLAVNAAFIPESSLKIIGIGGQYVFINGPDPLPVVSARVAYSALLGDHSLNGATTSIELLGGLDTQVIEPFIGAGYALSDAASKWDVRGSQKSQKANWADMYMMIGTQLELFPHFGTDLEVHISSLQTSYFLRTSVRF